VSTPLEWREVDDKIVPQDFTIKTVEARLEKVGDLWAPLRTTKPADLERALAKLQK
jgi:bifunctional non-homologous end joining protein LigD